MNIKPSFLNGALIGLFISFIGAIGFYGLALIMPFMVSAYLMIGILGITYHCYLSSTQQSNKGLVSSIVILVLITMVSWLFAWSLLTVVSLNCFLIWMFRIHYFHKSAIGAIGDLAILIGSTFLSAYTFAHTDSLFLSIWVFFLCQALFVLIPESIVKNSSPHHHVESKFSVAKRNAQSALNQLNQAI